jgi:CheY-like chemotaxis protein
MVMAANLNDHLTGAMTCAALKGRRLILLAEDDEINLEVMQAQLEFLGYETEVACDGAAALLMWRSGGYALLLTDCYMPDLDGFELTAAIRREESSGARLPIVAVTADAIQGTSERCIAQGMDDYLIKPVCLDELSRMLTKWLPQYETSLADYPVWDGETLTLLMGHKPDMHRHLLEKFLLKARERIDEVRLAQGDREVINHALHALKSAARTVGALRLGELCQVMEEGGMSVMDLNEAFVAVECVIKTVLQLRAAASA